MSADPSTTLYVDPAGNSTTGCTSPGASACTTIGEAVAAAELLTDDVTINVAAATYDENVVIDDTTNPSLTIAGAGEATTKIDGGAAGSDVTISAGVVTITGMSLTNGDSTNGGAVDDEDVVTLTDDSLSNNNADNGAGVYDHGTATMTNDTVSNDSASGDGGGVDLVQTTSQPMLTATNVIFHMDTANRGGGVSNQGAFTITGSTFSNDSANEGGGLADFAFGDLYSSTFTDDNVTGGSAEGGGVYNFDKNLTMTGDSFIGDSSTTFGGGLYTTGPVTASQDTFSADTAQYGAGIKAGGLVTLTNSTLIGDDASVTGGAIDDTSTTTLSDDTLSNDTAPAGQGPGIYDGNTVNLGSSILDKAGCTLPPGATMNSDGYNVESDNSCALGAGNLVSNSKIGLASALAANGSTTEPKTLAIAATSSAVDEVPAAACTVTTDERGDTRPGVTSQTACDAGAYEYQGAAPKPPVVKKKPSAPRSPHAKAGKKSIRLSWKAPASNGGLTISAYHAYCSLKKKVATKGAGTKTTGKHQSVTVKKLKAKKKYYCVVVATNAKGSSPASAGVSAKTKK